MALEAAEVPLSRVELASRDLTVADGGSDPALRQAFSLALAREGFTVVSHPPYHEQLEVTLSVERTVAVATLRSDGFFVEEARATLDGNDATGGRTGQDPGLLAGHGRLRPQQRHTAADHVQRAVGTAAHREIDRR